MLLSSGLIFFGGKGGVGKTTLAAAHAVSLGRAGMRTLLVSTDPAHSIGDLLGMALSDEPSEVENNLWALESDPGAHVDAFVRSVTEDARTAVSPEVFPTVQRHLDLAKLAPGIEESALLEHFIDLMAQCPGAYDRVVFDTAPTGHTMRLLQLPALLSVWIEGLVRQRDKVSSMERFAHNLVGEDSSEPDPLMDKLRARRRRVEDARERLLDDATFHLVVNPERLPIEEAARTLDVLSSSGIDIGSVLVNRVLPDVDEGEFLRARLEQQRHYLDEIERRFGDHPLVYIEQAAHDIATREQLVAVARPLAVLG